VTLLLAVEDFSMIVSFVTISCFSPILRTPMFDNEDRNTGNLAQSNDARMQHNIMVRSNVSFMTHGFRQT
jgi:hypothetical protein